MRDDEIMQRSTSRILTTHTGSLPRPRELTRLYALRAQGETANTAEIDRAGRDAVRAQRERRLGTRQRATSAETSAFNVIPDLLITANESRFVLDAKYKTNSDKGKLRISEADTYEAFAYSKATDCESVVLAYPALPGKQQLPIGQVDLFERINIDKTRIYGVQVEVRGISRKGGLAAFSRRLQLELTELLAAPFANTE